MNPIEKLIDNNKAIAECIEKQVEINKLISSLLEENKKYEDLLLTFKSMFTDSGNDLYLEMIKKVGL